MASTTTNLGLTKPAYTDSADVAVINSNMDILDTKIGAIGSTSVASQIGTLSEQIGPYGESQWVGNVTSIDALDSLITPGRYLRYLNIANVGIPGGWAVIDVSALKGYDNYIQVVTYPNTGESYTRHHPTNGTWGNFNSLVNNLSQLTDGNSYFVNVTLKDCTGTIADQPRYQIPFDGTLILYGRFVIRTDFARTGANPGFTLTLPSSIKLKRNIFVFAGTGFDGNGIRGGENITISGSANGNTISVFTSESYANVSGTRFMVQIPPIAIGVTKQ